MVYLYNLIYLIIWCIIALFVFNVLRTIKLERIFTQGKVKEIRLAYIILTIILSFLTTEAIFKFCELLIPQTT